MAKKARIWDGSQWIDIASAVTDLTQYANLTTTPISGFRNAIINGDFRINQRGFTSTTTNNAYGHDRWMIETNTGTCTYSTQAFALGNAIPGYEPINHARLVTSGQSASSAYSILEQRIEDVRTFAGQTTTISFWAKAGSGTPKISVDLGQNFGTGGSPSTTVNSYAGQVTLSTSWSCYSITFTVPSISGKTIGTNANTSSLNIFLWVSAGTDYNSRTNSLGIQSNTFDFWGVQVEKGSIATPLEQRPIGTELALCQRYYTRGRAYQSGYGSVATVDSGAYAVISFPVTMRVTPTAITEIAKTLTGSPAGYSSGVTYYDVSGFGYRYHHGGSSGSGNLAFDLTWSVSVEL